jgi:hypothetical protein
MSSAALVWIVIAAVNVGIDIARHGTPKTGKHCGWSSVIGTAIGAAILAWGGFFARH